ncbi:hypothetical protein BU25DRAFT_349420 [Macroventuria anomochaeta]|uniref:Uncharacterized protein n=1 Tax=Macroventuria anomochaeta TaxID=301207 RepID=A0ACB6RQN3_9PLEO|nr:uncharacterized protein BU25DRAFT_349420 [Macroventuria anomochaeta]KAF2623710.1 hypothetical protein BU25DRAFT_349420 [Macroventuria anomochaeta]
MYACEVAFNNAICNLNSSVFTSQQKAAKAYGVVKSIIQERLASCQSHTIAHQHQQQLTLEQEDFLVQWILEDDSCAQPPTHTCIQEMATCFLHMNHNSVPLGNEWISQFLSQQPCIASDVGQTIKTPRAQAASPDVIRTSLELFV